MAIPTPHRCYSFSLLSDFLEQLSWDLKEGSNHDKQRLGPINKQLLSSYRGPGAGEDAEDLEGMIYVSPLCLSSSFISFLSFSVFCFLTLQMLLTAKLEDEERSHYLFTFGIILVSYHMLSFGLKIQR